MNWTAFFALHSDLPREGPGCPADVEWACDLAGVARDARILDAGCGPGADIAVLRARAPDGRVTAIDAHAPFVDQARQIHGADPGVALHVGDMAEVEGPFDFIWCAGALYFLGLEDGLATLAGKLAPGGCIAFSHLVYTVAEPDRELRTALEAELLDIAGEAELRGRIEAIGFASLGERVLPKQSWDAYFLPMAQRIKELRPKADAALNQVLDEAEAEIALLGRFPGQFSYALSVVRPA